MKMINLCDKKYKGSIIYVCGKNPFICKHLKTIYYDDFNTTKYFFLCQITNSLNSIYNKYNSVIVHSYERIYLIEDISDITALVI